MLCLLTWFGSLWRFDRRAEPYTPACFLTAFVSPYSNFYPVVIGTCTLSAHCSSELLHRFFVEVSISLTDYDVAGVLVGFLLTLRLVLHGTPVMFASRQQSCRFAEPCRLTVRAVSTPRLVPMTWVLPSSGFHEQIAQLSRAPRVARCASINILCQTPFADMPPCNDRRLR